MVNAEMGPGDVAYKASSSSVWGRYGCEQLCGSIPGSGSIILYSIAVSKTAWGPNK
jgi:hypothetical protein